MRLLFLPRFSRAGALHCAYHTTRNASAFIQYISAHCTSTAAFFFPFGISTPAVNVCPAVYDASRQRVGLANQTRLQATYFSKLSGPCWRALPMFHATASGSPFEHLMCLPALRFSRWSWVASGSRFGRPRPQSRAERRLRLHAAARCAILEGVPEAVCLHAAGMLGAKVSVKRAGKPIGASPGLVMVSEVERLCGPSMVIA